MEKPFTEKEIQEAIHFLKSGGQQEKNYINLASDKYHEITEEFKHFKPILVDFLTHFKGELTQNLQRFMKSMEAYSKQSKNDLENSIKHQPFKAVLGAGAIMALIGMYIGFKMQKKYK